MRVAACVLFVGCLVQAAPGQWGQYLGPGDLAPPEPKRVGERGGIRDLVLTADLSQWQFWWEIHKDRYLALDPPDPLDSDTINEKVVPVLTKALGSGVSQIVSAALVALARIRAGDADPSIEPFVARLSSPDERVRETAALALGICGAATAFDPLADTLQDAELDPRTRAFAAIGIGLVARANQDLGIQARCVSTLTSVVSNANVHRDTKIAAVLAMGMLDLDPGSEIESRLLGTCLGTLEMLFLIHPDGDAQLERLQSHAPGAIANLLGAHPPDDLSRPYKEMFLQEVQGEGSVERMGSDPRRSAVIALGLLCGPADSEEHPEWKYSDALRGLHGARGDQQAKSLALMALAEIGGEANLEHLLNVLATGMKAIDRPWAALALGVYARKHGDAQDRQRIGEALHRAIPATTNPYALAALGVGGCSSELTGNFSRVQSRGPIP